LVVDGNCAITNLSFKVGFGEVLGIGGVDGNGQVELAEALAHVRSFKGEMSPVSSIGYVPQDRQTDGLALTMSVEENIGIAEVSLSGTEAIQQFDIKAQSFVAQKPIKKTIGVGELTFGFTFKIPV
jgi:ABC-type uncharacterized transport system ATPase subunit